MTFADLVKQAEEALDVQDYNGLALLFQPHGKPDKLRPVAMPDELRNYGMERLLSAYVARVLYYHFNFDDPQYLATNLDDMLFDLTDAQQKLEAVCDMLRHHRDLAEEAEGVQA